MGARIELLREYLHQFSEQKLDKALARLASAREFDHVVFSNDQVYEKSGWSFKRSNGEAEVKTLPAIDGRDAQEVLFALFSRIKVLQKRHDLLLMDYEQLKAKDKFHSPLSLLA